MLSARTRPRHILAMAACALGLTGMAAAWVQLRGWADAADPSPGEFQFARVAFNSYRFRGWTPGWAHDYPRADRNFLRIIREVTFVETTPVAFAVVRLEDAEIMDYPLLYFSEPGTWDITPQEADNFRQYLLRGGFAIFDDFDGMRDWLNFEYCMQQVLPHRPLVQLTIDHPIFHSFFDIRTLDVAVPSNVRVQGNPLFYGLFDETGRLQAIANFNNDIGDFWEWSDEGWYPIPISNEAFKFGVNYLIYAMTH